MKATSSPEPRTAPLVLAFRVLGALLLVLAVVATLRRRPGPDGLPVLVVLHPAPGDTVTGTLRVTFRTPAPLAPGPMGWSAQGLHPHVLLDGREHMAAAADIEALPDAYRWTLPPLSPGMHTLLLTWAGADHRIRGDTTGRTIRLFAR